MLIRKTTWGSLFLLTTLLTAGGCSSALPGDDGETGGDALTAGAQNFKVGDVLVATTGLNLREEASATSPILGVIRSGGSVTVTAEEGATAATETAQPNPAELDANPDVVTPADPAPADDGTDPSAPDDAAPATTTEEGLPLPPVPPAEVPPVLQATNGFWHVTYGTKVGWASGRYLRKASGTDTDTTSGNTTGDASTCMNRLSSVARRMDGSSSQGRCYRYVKTHVASALGVGLSSVQTMLGARYRLGAYDFARWVEANPGGRASAAGFVESNNISLDALPLGAILVWRPGQCGYHPTYGHIEVNVGRGRACSDFCGRIRRTCGQPKIVLLQKACR